MNTDFEVLQSRHEESYLCCLFLHSNPDGAPNEYYKTYKSAINIQEIATLKKPKRERMFLEVYHHFLKWVFTILQLCVALP